VHPYLTSSELSVHPAQYQINIVIGRIRSIVPKENGRNVFQVRDIKRSYRIRGRVPRAHRKVKAIIVVQVTSTMSLIIKGE